MIRLPPAVLMCGLAAGCAAAAMAAIQTPSILMRPDEAEWRARAPERFRVRLETTKGDIAIDVERALAPYGVDRFYNLVRLGFYDDTRFFRVVAGRWAQFGIHGDPAIAKLWRQRTIPDDERKASNVRGSVAFAFAVPNGRTTQIYIALQDLSATQDAQGFAPIGRVAAGMDVADALNSEYGETAGGGIRAGKQDPVYEGGNAYLARLYPRLDAIRKARIEMP
jgi:homoserine O-acetyltransferase/O-succinyltransferase